ncbi:MAG: cytochrome c oxidase subunit 3 family protein [Candidatus Dadabacteria bacterium]|nr:MAG: cytochrome c oxidase subunit 3 family protein [Candidatus Dadabacteria bacterium]
MSNAEEALAGEPPHVHHMDPETAYTAAKFGMWLFLATEILLFGVLFSSFAIYRWMYLDFFHHASQHLNWKLGAINTAILIFSSYTAAVAVTAAQTGDNQRVARNLLITIICGAIFLIIKYIEYSAKYHHGIFPGTDYWNSEEFGSKYRMYFGLYYTMTGLHALHVFAGMCLLFWVRTKAVANRFSPKYYTPVEVGALYWHLVDLIWIYLFPLLYLVK